MRDYKYFVDTNIFLRPVVKDDPQKVKACESLFRLISEGKIMAFTSHLVLAELVWTSQKSYRIPREEINNILRGILGIKNLKFREKLNASLAIEYYIQSNTKFIDALIASDFSFQKGTAKIISYDKDFDKIKIPRVEPHQLL